MLQRREKVMQVGRRRLLPDLPEKCEAGLLAPFRHHVRQPFAVAAVEDEHAVSGLEPQDVEQIVGLLALQRQDGLRRKSPVDEKPVAGEIGNGHGRKRFLGWATVVDDVKNATIIL
ncbi:hypothetical protein BTHI11S_02571 [Bosea thiooxidans]